jgi:SAM-dependent methyltransferase
MTDASGLEAEDWAQTRGSTWLAELDLYEQMLEPLGIALLARADLEVGQRVADIGCGGGWTSRQAARAVGIGGRVHGIDITPVLVAEATRRAKAEEIGNLRFSIGDASYFQPDDAPFDRLLSRLGVMFFADPLSAFGHLRTLLVEGGLADFAVWAPPQDNVWMSRARAIAATHVELPSPDPVAPGPFALADRDRLEDVLDRAGFCSIEIAAWNGRMPLGGIGSDARRAADFALRAFSFADGLIGAAPELIATMRAELIAFFQDFQTPEGIEVPAKAWLVRAAA